MSSPLLALITGWVQVRKSATPRAYGLWRPALRSSAWSKLIVYRNYQHFIVKLQFDSNYHRETEIHKFKQPTKLIFDFFPISIFRKAPLTLNLLTTTIVAPPSNASKWQMGFNSAFKGLTQYTGRTFLAGNPILWTQRWAFVTSNLNRLSLKQPVCKPRFNFGPNKVVSRSGWHILRTKDTINIAWTRFNDISVGSWQYCQKSESQMFYLLQSD